MLTLALAALLLIGVCSGQGPPRGPTAPSKSCGEYRRCVRRDLCNNLRARERLGGTYCNDMEVCCPIQDLVQVNEPRKKPSNSKCGHRNIHGLMGMMQTNMSAPEENEAEYGEFPWTVAILEVRIVPGFVQSRFHCGGSLIHPRVALTAAHNMKRKPSSNFTVRAGEWDPHSTDEPHPCQDIQVKDIIVHQNFSKSHLIYDAALLILVTPFVMSPHINTICLPDADMVTVSSGCFVAGWGTKAFQMRLHPAKLKKIELSVLPQHQCNRNFRNTVLGKFFSLHSSFICAGGEAEQDACTGDGGSALMCPIPDKRGFYYQAGIVSWGIGCGESNVPGVYANVAKFRLWIDRVLAENNLNE